MYDHEQRRAYRLVFLAILLFIATGCGRLTAPLVPATPTTVKVPSPSALAAPSVSATRVPTAQAAAPTLAPTLSPTVPPATPTQLVTQVTGPIWGMVAASSIDDKGQPVNPRFSFQPDEPQVTIVVQVGKIQDLPLTITWYQEKDDGETKLFTHTISVASYDRAYSIGTNPAPGEPILAPGEYKVVATLGGQSQELIWSVASPPPPAAVPGGAGGGTPQPALQPESGVPPASGASGKKAGSPAPQTGNVPGGATNCNIGMFDFSAGPPMTVGLHFTATVADRIKVLAFYICGTTLQNAMQFPVEVSSTLNGATAVYQTTPPSDPTTAPPVLAVDPCAIGKGSDLPGTNIRLEDVGLNGTQRVPDNAGTSPSQFTLGDDTSAPTLDVKSTPPGGSKVKAGDQIKVTATATEQKSGASWQTGVGYIQIWADPSGTVLEWTNPSSQPLPCSQKTWSKDLSATYTVPPNPPAQFQLCVYTKDLAPKPNWSKSCATFHTGNTWKGSFQSVMSEELRDRPADVGGNWSCSNETWDGEFQVDVGANGDVIGKGSAHLAAAPKCSGDFQYVQKNCNAGLAASLLVVKGTFDGKEFHLVFPIVAVGEGECGLATMDMLFWEVPNSRTPPDFVVPVIAPGDAEGQVNNSLGPRTMPLGGILSEKGTHTFRLLCQDCK